MPLRSVLVLPLVVMALLAGTVGFMATRALTPPTDDARVSVIALPSTPTPSPEPTPSPSPKVSSSTRVRVRNGEVTGGSCPAGCSCDQLPNGIVIRCTGG